MTTTTGTTTDTRPIIERLAVSADMGLGRDLTAAEVTEVVAHLTTQGVVEYTQRSDVAGANALAADGWRLHSVVPCGGQVWYVMERPAEPAGEIVDLRRRLADVEAERDLLVQGFADEERRAAHYRDVADELAGQVQRVRDLPGHNSDGRVRDYLPRASVLAALDGGGS